MRVFLFSFVCAGEGIQVLSLFKTCQKSVNCVVCFALWPVFSPLDLICMFCLSVMCHMFRNLLYVNICLLPSDVIVSFKVFYWHNYF